jgi:hypothetical protein
MLERNKFLFDFLIIILSWSMCFGFWKWLTHLWRLVP